MSPHVIVHRTGRSGYGELYRILAQQLYRDHERDNNVFLFLAYLASC
jgi:hypothetical protein